MERLVAGREEWPLRVVTEVYVFGSYARGATEPHDVDLVVEIDRQDDQWLAHFGRCLFGGKDPHSLIRRELAGASRGCQFLFEARDRVDFPLTLLWHTGDPLSAALTRLDAIVEDQTAGRAPRDAMLPQFDGLDRWIARPKRERLIAAMDARAITVERLELPDQPVQDETALRHVAARWGLNSPLYRAALAVLAHFEHRGVDLMQVHLHGRDVGGPVAPYCAGFQMRYFRSVPYYLTEFHGHEWIEVIHPTRTLPNPALRILPVRPDLLVDADWT